MSKKVYLEDKRSRKKSASGAAYLLILAALVFLFVLIKFAIPTGAIFGGGMPSNDDAYTVAKDFVRSSVRSSEISFPGPGYQAAKKSDSVWVIRSAVETVSDNGEKHTSNFKVLIQYNGGKKDVAKNWSLLNISEQQ